MVVISRMKPTFMKGFTSTKTRLIIAGLMFLSMSLSSILYSSTISLILYDLSASSIETSNHPEEATLLAYVPITAYNACGGRIKHLSCKKTIITASVNPKTIPLLSDLSETLCDLIIDDNVAGTDNRNVDLCLQVGISDIIVGAVVRTIEKKEAYPFAEISSILTEEDLERVLPSVDTSGDFRIINRTVAITTGPRSINNGMLPEHDNTGNMIWNVGVKMLMNPFTTVFVRREFESPLEDLNKFGVSPAVYVIGTANIFNVESLNSGNAIVNRLKENIETFNLPTLMIGAGIQFDFTTMPLERFVESDVLHDSHKQLLQTLEDHKKGPYAVSVRGNLTETACTNGGFSHCIALGCPSFMLNRSHNLGSDLTTKWVNVLQKLNQGETIRVGVVLPTPGYEKKSQEASRQLISSLAKIYDTQHNVYFIHQTLNDERVSAEIVTEKNHTVSFKNIEDWGKFTAGLDIMISTRIHGGMAGIMSGTPAVIIPTDMRIMELVNAMTLPTLSMEMFLNLNPQDLLSMLQLVHPDFLAFELKRRETILKYKGMLNDVGLELDPQLLAIMS